MPKKKSPKKKSKGKKTRILKKAKHKVARRIKAAGKAFRKAFRKKAKRPAKRHAKKMVKKAAKKAARVRKVLIRPAKPVAKPIKKAAALPPKNKVGEVTHFYSHISVAVVKLESILKEGDKISIEGATTNFTQTANSMQMNHETVLEARPGDEIGLKVKDKVREGDAVYKL